MSLQSQRAHDRGSYDLIGDPVNRSQIDDILHDVDIFALGTRIPERLLRDQQCSGICQRLDSLGNLNIAEQHLLNLKLCLEVAL